MDDYSFDKPHAGVLMDVGAKVNQLNRVSRNITGQDYGRRWYDYPENVASPEALTTHALAIVGREPDCWFTDLSASLSLAMASQPADLEAELLRSSAILTAWIADLRSRSTNTAHLSN